MYKMSLFIFINVPVYIYMYKCIKHLIDISCHFKELNCLLLYKCKISIFRYIGLYLKRIRNRAHA